MTLTPAARDVLQGAVADHNTIRTPIITDRATYTEVHQVLGRLAGGGHWDTRERAFVYHRDPRQDLQTLTGTVVVPPPSAYRDKEMSYWPTPPALAADLVADLDLQPGSRVLEPSAGDGALVRAVRDAYLSVHITAVEPDLGRRTYLRRTGPVGMHVWDGTLEDYAAFAGPAGIRFDAVVMNPPFTLPGQRYAWAQHLTLAWDRLLPGGLLRAIVPPSLEFGRQRPVAAVRDLVTDVGGSWRKTGPGAFRMSGTDVHTLIVTATKDPGDG
jgi:phospholipid N-methyltransferase